MNVLRLSIQEIVHRKLSFALGLLSVMIAVGVLVGSLTMLGGHDLRTEELVAQKEAEVREEMAQLEDDYRVIMKDMGYNVLILHRDQDMEELQRLNYPTHYMPEDWAQQLADQNVETLNHLLPLLQEVVSWPEMEREVLLTGVRGQLAFRNSPKNKRPPIMQPVEQGDIKFGSELAADLGVAVGDTVTMRGKKLTVREVYGRRGTQDDHTAWVSLKQAQEWLGRPGQINGGRGDRRGGGGDVPDDGQRARAPGGDRQPARHRRQRPAHPVGVPAQGAADGRGRRDRRPRGRAARGRVPERGHARQ